MTRNRVKRVPGAGGWGRGLFEMLRCDSAGLGGGWWRGCWWIIALYTPLPLVFHQWGWTRPLFYLVYAGTHACWRGFDQRWFFLFYQSLSLAHSLSPSPSLSSLRLSISVSCHSLILAEKGQTISWLRLFLNITTPCPLTHTRWSLPTSHPRRREGEMGCGWESLAAGPDWVASWLAAEQDMCWEIGKGYGYTASGSSIDYMHKP